MGIITVEGLGQVEISGDAPSAAEQEAIVNALQQQKPDTPSPAASAPKKDRSWLEAAARKASALNYGLGEGVAGLFGLPADLINMGSQAIGGPALSDKYFPTSKGLQGSLQTLGLMQRGLPADSTQGEQIMRGVGMGIGSAAVPVGAGAAIAKAGVKPLTKAGQLVDDVLAAPMRTAPGRTLAAETGIGATSGAGAAVGEMATEGTPYAAAGPLVGGIMGGMVPAAGIAASSKALDAGKRAVRPFTQAGIKDQVAQTLQQNVRDPSETIKAIERTQADLQGTGIQPTSAQASGDAGLAAMERYTAKRSPQFEAELRERQAQGEGIVRKELAGLTPEGAGAQGVSDYIAGTAQQILGETDQAIGRAAKSVEDAENALSPARTRMEANRQAFEELNSANEAWRARNRQLYESVDPNNEVLIPAEGLRGKFDKIQKDVDFTADPASVPSPIFDLVKQRFGKDGEPIAYQSWDKLRSRVMNDIRREEGQIAPDRYKVKILSQMLDAVDGELDTFSSAATKSLPPDDPRHVAATNLAVAREHFKQGADKFRKGTVSKILRSGRNGEVTANPISATLDAFFTAGRGAPEAAEDFIRAVGGSEQANAAMRDYIAGRFLDGTADAKFLAKHSDALNAFPEAREELRQVVRAKERLQLLQGKKAEVSDQFKKSVVHFFLDKDPEKAIGSILSSGAPVKHIQAIKQSIGKDNKVQQANLKRGFWDHMMSKTAQRSEVGAVNPLMEPMRMRKFMQDNGDAYRALFEKKELDQLDRMTSIAEKYVAGKIPEASPAAGESPIVPFEILWNRLYRLNSPNFVSPNYVKFDLAGRYLRGFANKLTMPKIQALLEDALVNPDTAKMLLTRVTNKNHRSLLESLQFIAPLTTPATASFSAQNREEQGDGR